jgi:hypothetical protein
MKALSLSAGVLAAALSFAATMPAAAADLDYHNVPGPDRYGSAYDDPRYRDLYGPEPSPGYTYAPRDVEPRYRAEAHLPPPGPVPPGYVYGDRDGPHYGERHASRYPRPDWRQAEHCLHPGQIKRRLVEDGWSEFQDVDANARVARVRARRANGDLFALRIDRCTGDILKTVLIGRDGYGPYASRHDTHRSFDRRYY